MRCDAMRGCRLPVVVVMLLHLPAPAPALAPALARTWQQIPAKVGQALDTSALARKEQSENQTHPHFDAAPFFFPPTPQPSPP